MEDREARAVERGEVTDPTAAGRGGMDRRRFLGGVGGATVGAMAGGAAVGSLLGASPALASGGSACRDWGPRVDLAGLADLYAPQEVVPYTVRPGGIDNLGLHSTDVFTIPGRGEFVVDFTGYFRVARSHPTTTSWTTFEVTVNILDLRLQGANPALGPVTVRLNPDILAAGQIFAASGSAQGAACRIATGATFEMQALGVTVFNKEPILLMNSNVRSIPPVDDPNGQAQLFRLPLFDLANPDGPALAYLTSLRYGADHYITEAQAQAIRGG